MISPLLVVSITLQFAPAQDWVKTAAPTAGWAALACSADGTKVVAASNGFGTPGPIFTSTNAGQTWTQCSVTGQWTSVASSADGARLVASTTSAAIWTSTNSGATWARQIGPRYGLTALASSADGTKLAGPGDNFVYTSADFGQNWSTTSSSNWFGANITSSADGGTLASFTEGNGFLFRFFFSTNSGNSWNEIDGPFSSNSAGTLACSADGKRFVLAVGFVGILTTTNLGTTWETSDAPGDSGWTSVACSADGTRIVASTTGISIDLPGSIYTSADSGVTWVEANVARTNWFRVASSADGTRLFAIGGGNGAYSGIYSWQALPPPLLNIASMQGNLVLSWDGSFNATVQQSSNLAEGNWSAATVQPILSNGQYQVVLQGPLVGNNFFRLKLP